MWVVGKIENGSHYESQPYSGEEERLARYAAIQTDADNNNLSITIEDMTDEEYQLFMTQ